MRLLSKGANQRRFISNILGPPRYPGEIVIFDTNVNGVEWHFEHSGDGSALPWRFIGGGELSSDIDASESTTSATYVDLTTVGPSVTLLLPGDYELRYGADLYSNSAVQSAFYSPSIAGGAPSDADRVEFYGAASVAASVARARRKVTIASSSVVKMQARGNGGSQTTAAFRWLRATPIRCA